VGHRAGLDTKAGGKIICLYRGWNPIRPVCNQTLYYLNYPGAAYTILEWPKTYLLSLSLYFYKTAENTKFVQVLLKAASEAIYTTVCSMCYPFLRRFFAASENFRRNVEDFTFSRGFSSLKVFELLW
jgi:hypothetical protein